MSGARLKEPLSRSLGKSTIDWPVALSFELFFFFFFLSSSLSLPLRSRSLSLSFLSLTQPPVLLFLSRSRLDDRSLSFPLSLFRLLSDRLSSSYSPRITGIVSALENSDRGPSGAVANVAYDEATEAGAGGYEFLDEGPAGLSSIDRDGFLAEEEDTSDSARRLEDEEDDFLRPSSLLLLRLHMVRVVMRGHARGVGAKHDDGCRGGGC